MSADRDEATTAPGSAVSIGAFDGVHLGHRRLIAELRRLAQRDGLRSVVVTFDRHPASVVRPESAPQLLTDLSQKLELLRGTGVDEVVVIEFDTERAAESAETFVTEVLVDRLAARLVIVGDDFHFGNGRTGNVGLLRKMGAELGFETVGYELVEDEEDGIVSSTRIRALLAEGGVEGAARLLGREHEVRGVVTSPGAGAGAGPVEIVVEVPAEIELPAAGRYRVEVADDGAVPRAAEAVVAPRPVGRRELREVRLMIDPGAPGLFAGASASIRFAVRGD